MACPLCGNRVRTSSLRKVHHHHHSAASNLKNEPTRSTMTSVEDHEVPLGQILGSGHIVDTTLSSQPINPHSNCENLPSSSNRSEDIDLQNSSFSNQHSKSRSRRSLLFSQILFLLLPLLHLLISTATAGPVQPYLQYASSSQWPYSAPSALAFSRVLKPLSVNSGRRHLAGREARATGRWPRAATSARRFHHKTRRDVERVEEVVRTEAPPRVNVNLTALTEPKWINPCGISSASVSDRAHEIHNKSFPVTARSLHEIYHDIILAAKNALRHSKRFKEEYVKKTFNARSYWAHHDAWKNSGRFEWLPSWENIPKHLHERPQLSHLNRLEFEETLINMYKYLQMLAVGLEQVVFDQAAYNGMYLEEFNETEFRLKAVLCELQVAMLERNISVDRRHQDVSRRIMTKDIRHVENDSIRNLRDWYIYRDYMNSLEYAIDAFTHLKRNRRDH